MDLSRELHPYTEHGQMPLEVYVARVTTAENGRAAQAAQRAQAIAARTYVLRAMRDDPILGTYKKPVPSSEKFQVCARTATTQAIKAAADTAGIVCRYQGELIICNYVAGALWTEDGKPQVDPPAKTEGYVTYNEGKTGKAVKPSGISLETRSDNRGCMSQNGANWLARHGYDHEAILRYFYGADLEIGPLLASTPIGPAQSSASMQSTSAEPPAATSSPLPLIALAALVKLTME